MMPAPDASPEDTPFYGDNLEILRNDIADESVDLIYPGPPFNSNATYNVIFTIEELLNGKQPLMPWRGDSAFKKLRREDTDKQDELDL